MTKERFFRTSLSTELKQLMDVCPSFCVPQDRDTLLRLAMGDNPNEDVFEVAYEIPEKGRHVEAVVTRCRNGLSVNYTESYMRRRDPDCMLIADDQPSDKITFDFAPQAILYIAPPFRHTHFQGKQVVVHNRQANVHEIFAYNLYPGPSAKKGAYGVLIQQGEQEGWLTAPCFDGPGRYAVRQRRDDSTRGCKWWGQKRDARTGTS